MEIEQYYEEVFPYNEMVEGDQAYSQEKSYSPAPETVSNDYNGSYDCNICLDHARDPVVTLCGHLYCWPCIYKWLHTQSTSFIIPEEQQKPQCPVCKADVSDTTLVPLYGRGDLSSERELNCKDSSDIEIPRRPPAYGVHALVTNPNQQFHSRPYNVQTHFPTDQSPQYYPQNYSAASPIINLGGITNHPMMAMFSEMAYASVFGNSNEVNLIGYGNSYQHHLRGSSARIRRQEMKAEKSLNRVSIFVFCCIVLCLLLF
ncbi:E3 ubiquitin-protein ligase rma1h1-like [Thalictrum thalictroides]|uniref:E3 ubiquitin-protein ligase RMA n=1 Tax=Thalictrum thalictroides TaxID=46969 RepID=A0A7J6VKC9_THATH|nr:E3 ubiquitin-protein ligase rma1h1-like [Thalictrum thalictroides]